ncbi:hypothetical protein [Pseudomonas juntendi]|uniref:hypothetical protein n=1 Tax=Pseudomonas juntendi TaxID=2666183 RepID=UPI00244A5925|nr:hypothetical protein [Pseudomonas juntendi]MDG9890583.1 hypothetical protein [Pseudomonas juntendi]
MSGQEVREQFEEWHNRATAEMVKAGEIIGARRMQAFKPIMQAAWEASREDLMVSLPPRVPVRTLASREEASKDVDYLVGSSYNLAIDNCQKQIELLGIKAAD